MNIRLGVYEIFSRIVPGGLYIAAALHLLLTLGVLNFDLQTLNDLSFATSLGLVVGAYTVGGALDRLALSWFRLFAQHGIHERVFAQFKKQFQSRWELDFHSDDWQLLLAFLRTKDQDLASEVDRHNAVSIMLRNVSLGLVWFAVNSLVLFITSRQPVFLLVLAILVALSILIIREATKFREWFYNDIYQTVLAYRINIDDLVKPAPAKTKHNLRK